MKIIKSLKSRKSRRSLRAEQHSLIIQYFSHLFYSFISSFHRFIYLLVAEKSAAAEGEYIPIERREIGAAILFSHHFLPLLVGAERVVVLENARSCAEHSAWAPLGSAILQVSLIQKRSKCDSTQNSSTLPPLISMRSSGLEFNNTVISGEFGHWRFNSLRGGFDPGDSSLEFKGASRHLEASYWGFMELWT